MTNEHVVQCLSHGGYFHLWLCILVLKAGIKICFMENKSGHHKNWCPTQGGQCTCKYVITNFMK